MKTFKLLNKLNITRYLKEIKSIDSNFTELFYPSAVVAIDALYKFNGVFSDDQDIIYDSLDINETIKLVKEFLLDFDSLYLKEFNELLNYGIIDIFDIKDVKKSKKRLPYSICIEEERRINIPINNNIDDGANIVHEFSHFINAGKESLVRSTFTETISFYMELRYYLFLSKKGYSINNLNKRVYSILESAINDSSNNVIFPAIILEAYQKYGDVTIDSIKSIDKYKIISDGNIKDLIKFSESKNASQDIYDYENSLSYLLGSIIAINLIKNPKANDEKIRYLNVSFNQLSIDKAFDIIGFDINDPDKFIDNCYDALNIEGDIFDNSDSRSYRRRKNKIKY